MWKRSQSFFALPSPNGAQLSHSFCEHFEDFISDVDPGARFSLLCQAAQKHPETKHAITIGSAEEYILVSRILTECCGYDEPLDELKAVVDLSQTPAGNQLMSEWTTFEYKTSNLPIRVMTSHFMDFCRSKITHPHFFCWPGKALALVHSNDKFQELFVRHMSFFTDRADSEQIFTRAFVGRDATALKRTLDTFMGSTILYDLTFQWILNDGPFRYDFRSITHQSNGDALEAWAKGAFKKTFGYHPDEFKQLA